MPFDREDVACLIDDDHATLIEPLTYRGNRHTFVVPAGSWTDFASVPACCTWLVPKMGAFTRAAILHDHLCSALEQGDMRVTARDVDGIFRRVMREAGVPVVRRWLMWTAVRWGALQTPARRHGWLRDAPAVAGISALALPLVAPPALLALAGAAVYAAVEWVAGRL